MTSFGRFETSDIFQWKLTDHALSSLVFGYAKTRTKNVAANGKIPR